MSAPLFEIAREQIQHQLPFVLYRKPNSDQLSLIIQSSQELNRVSTYTEKGFVMAPFDLQNGPVLLKPDKTYIASFEISANRPEGKTIDHIPDRTAKAAHIDLVSKALGEIKAGNLKKVVVSRTIEIPLEDNPLDRFYNLLCEHSNAFCYFWYHPATAIWMGATPELFLSVDNSQLSTYALAGTKTAIKGKEPDWTFKELEEQRMVTDFIRSQLQKTGLVTEASNTISFPAAKLWHLKTEIRAALSGQELGDIIKRLHPTPAVCGLPNDKAFEFLREHEDYNRNFYTGFLGELNLKAEQQCAFFVNLRCMSWSDNHAKLYVGGGITHLSVPEDEWKETEEKSRTILDALF